MVSFPLLSRLSGNTGFIPRVVFLLSLLLCVAAQAQITVTTTALPAGTTSNQYYVALTASGGTAPYTWQLISGSSLPSGLTLSSQGVISGNLTTLTAGTPPVPPTFTVQVNDSSPVPNTATQNYSITVLPSGSHSLVLNQVYTGANGSTSAIYSVDYVEIFNAGPVAVDLQNWTLQYVAAQSNFTVSSNYPIGSLDPYQAGTTLGTDGQGHYPAFQITYSAAFTASNCNQDATHSQLNTAFPPLHCWLNAGQFLLVQIAPSGSTAPTHPQTFPLTADLDLSGDVASNLGAIAATSGSPTNWINHNGTAGKPSPSSGKMALVNSVNVGVSCPVNNPAPSPIFSPLASDFVAYVAAGGSATMPNCWEGAAQANYLSSSAKNTQAIIRSAPNGTATGTVLSASAVPTPCGDTDNNVTDFGPMTIGTAAQANWILHNSQQSVTKATIASPVSYTPTACPAPGTSQPLNIVGPILAATVDKPAVGSGDGGGSVTETLSVKITPSSSPTATLFSVHADLSGIAGATSIAPLSPSSVGVPDSTGNLVYQEAISIPTATPGTFTIPVTVLDDAYRGGSNANGTTPLNVTITISAECQAPTATAQSLQVNWNSSSPVTLSGQLGGNCNSGDTLTYAVAGQPAHGRLNAGTGNQLIYTPTAGFSSQDAFTFTVTDSTNASGALTSTPATVALVVNATGVTPTIALSCPSVTYDDSPHGCTATTNPFVAGSTTITYGGTATVPTTAGSYTVNASFVSSGDATQNTSSTGTLVINQAVPVLTLSCPTVPFDGSTHGCTATTVGVGATTVNGTTSITYNGSAALPSDGGTYAASATFISSNPNYAGATATSSLTINEPLLTITANPQTVVFGGTLPTLSYTTSPSVPLTVAPVCTSSANGTSPVGTYTSAITCSGAAKPGNQFMYVAGTLTVTTATATVVANNQTMTSGSTLPSLTFTTTPAGVVFSTPPACTTTATSNSPAGSYPITCSGGVSPDYTLTYSGAMLSVTPAPTVPNLVPAITALSPPSIASGAANTVVTVKGSGFVSGATVNWNGAARATTFVSSTQLTAAITASDVASTGTADVAVFNPAPGGGPSPSMTISIDSASGTAGNFSVSAANPTVSITHGQSAVVQLTLSNLQQGAVVSAVCYNLPTLASCSYNAGTLAIGTDNNTPIGAYQVLIVCNTGSTTASTPSPAAIWYGILGLPLGLLTLRRANRTCRNGLVVLCLFLFALGCGGSSGGKGSSVTITAAQASAAMTVTVK
jgi:hypothetical protein